MSVSDGEDCVAALAHLRAMGCPSFVCRALAEASAPAPGSRPGVAPVLSLPETRAAVRWYEQQLSRTADAAEAGSLMEALCISVFGMSMGSLSRRMHRAVKDEQLPAVWPLEGILRYLPKAAPAGNRLLLPGIALRGPRGARTIGVLVLWDGTLLFLSETDITASDTARRRPLSKPLDRLTSCTAITPRNFAPHLALRLVTMVAMPIHEVLFLFKFGPGAVFKFVVSLEGQPLALRQTLAEWIEELLLICDDSLLSSGAARSSQSRL